MSPPISDYGASTSSRRHESMRRSSTGNTSSWSTSKSKGKGRAIDVEEEGRSSDDDGDDEGDLQAIKGMSFCIRFTDGTTEDLLDLYVNNSEAIRDVKRRIRVRRPSLATSRLRLIYLGRVLSDGVRLVPYMTALLQRQRDQEERDTRSNIGGLLEGVVNRAVHSLEPGSEGDRAHNDDERHTGHRPKASMNPYESYNDSKTVSPPKNKGKGKAVEGSRTKDPMNGRKIWLHCSAGEPGSLQEEEEAAAAAAEPQQQVGQTAPLSGFDRLREAGFSEEDIENIRAQFHADGPSDTVVTGDEDEHARALEEQWMDNLGSGANSANGPGSEMYGTLFKGVIIGFFFPFLPLFFFRAPEGETPVFSKQMQMAIVAGLSINILYGALRAMS
ncbi:hypothetical protein P389DRAFT_97058 [Cystobasidium minutum MCA 4210]|uniref:uncharacterized protein n=1 Tax=Cystobasidium minutum MCA 4210 TaxID=1397322 RepID=UPI0034CF33CC|eukprot:jgi/Rhomi1/97058/CE97057_1344